MSTNMPIEITDHALVRWLERVHGIDMDWLREALLAQVEDSFVPGAARIIQDEIIYVFNGDTLVTVVEKRSRKKRKKAKGTVFADPAISATREEIGEIILREG